MAAVRCITCAGSGKASEVIAGVDWVAANLQLPAVVSMSLGADSTDAVLDAAVSAVIGLGAIVVAAAGNFNNGTASSHACAGCFRFQQLRLVLTLGNA